MWCPSCRGEYVEGLERCPRCGVGLVEDAPQAPPPTRRGLLVPASTAAIVGVVLILAVRAVGTVMIPQQIEILGAMITLHLVGYLALVAFLAAFLVEPPSGSATGVRVATGLTLTVVGAAAAGIALELANLLGAAVSPRVLRGGLVPVLSLLVPVAAVLFFATVRAHARRRDPELSRAAGVALVGSAVSATVHIGVAAWWRVIGSPDMVRASPALLIAGLVVSAGVTATLLVFFATVRRQAKLRVTHPL